MRRRLTLGVVGVISLLGLAGFVEMPLAQTSLAQQSAAKDAIKLRYGFQGGRKYAYDLKIVAKKPDADETLAGVLVVEAKRMADDQFTLTTSGSLAGKIRGMQPGFGDFPRISFPRFGEDRRSDHWVLDWCGKVIRVGSDDQTPYMLGPRDLLMIEPLPTDDKQTWNKTTQTRVVERGRTSRPVRGPFGAVLVIGHDATERTDYAVLASTPETVRISKKYSLTTTPKPEDDRQVTMSGNGELQFDRKLGVFKSGQINYAIETKEDELKHTLSVSMTYRLLSETELADHERQEQEAAEALAKANEPKPLTPAERQSLLEDLRPAEATDRTKAALGRLAKSVVGDRPDEISAAVVRFLDDSDVWIRAAAASALKVWATANAETALIDASRSENWMLRAPAIEALGRIKSPAAAEAVAAQFPRNRMEGSKALRAMGPVAEAATIPLLTNRDHWVRAEVCNVLKEIGGAASVAALEQARQAKNVPDRDSLDQAIAVIKRRLPPGATAAKEGEKPATATPAGAEPNAIRTWHDTSGVFEVEASFLERTNDKVLLKRKDGRTVQVPFAQLSPQDQAWVTQHGKPKAVNPFE